MALPQTPEQIADALRMLKGWRPTKETLLSGFASFPIMPVAPEPCAFNIPRVESIMQEMTVDIRHTVYVDVAPADMEIIREHAAELQEWVCRQVEKSMLICLLGSDTPDRATWRPSVGPVGRCINSEACT